MGFGLNRCGNHTTLTANALNLIVGAGPHAQPGPDYAVRDFTEQ
jgi:hypothetical protein